MALCTYINRVQFGFGALDTLAEELALHGVTRPLLVTDRGVAAAGLLDTVRAALPAAMPVAVYAGTPPNPTEAAVREAAAAYAAHRADGIVALGGGSSLDLAKAAGLVASHPAGPLAPYAVIEGGMGRITAAVPPIVAIPTTAGTGSEVGRGAIITLADGRKVAVSSPHFLPRTAICDPALTLGLPPLLTAGTGMDAITHCIETWLSTRLNPTADAIALDGLARGWGFLERAVRDGSDREARQEMMAASMHGAMAFPKGLGAVHAMAHPLGGIPSPSLHHGTLNAVLLPHVVRFNAPVVPERVAKVADVVGLADRSADAVAEALAALSARIGLPPTLRAMGAPREALPKIAAAAMRDHCHASNPRTATEAEYLALLEAAYGA